MAHATHAVDLFVECARAVKAGEAMTPRSKNDKEYFPQDWLIDRLTAVGLSYEQQGRNSYPDFWVGSAATPPIEGFEVKSLKFDRGKPARKDYDSNSTIPSGKKDGRDVFVVFFLYTGAGANPRPVHSLCIAHTNLINADHEMADAHVNAAIHDFGSYADGFIRNRKMYVFPTPFSIYPASLGATRLIVPAGSVSDPRLTLVETIERSVASDMLRSYTIDLQDQANPTVNKVPAANAGTKHSFDVFKL